MYFRYASLFNSYVGLLSAAEDSRPLLLIGMGARGMGPLRAAIEWTPVQAHATANPVTLFYVAQGQQSAAYLADWDQWREAGVGDAADSLFLSLGWCRHSFFTFASCVLQHFELSFYFSLTGLLFGLCARFLIVSRINKVGVAPRHHTTFGASMC